LACAVTDGARAQLCGDLATPTPGAMRRELMTGGPTERASAEANTMDIAERGWGKAREVLIAPSYLEQSAKVQLAQPQPTIC
jgi:hypothetical protein